MHSLRLQFATLGATALVLLGAVLAIPPSLLAQTEDAGPPAPPHNTFSISGSVVNSVTGEPIRRALVQISNLPVVTPSVLTDAEGRFQFAELSESDITVGARKPGFFNEQALHPDVVRPAMFFHVDANTPSILLRLVPEARLSGHVATVKGEPLEDTPIQAFQQRVVDGRRRWEQRGQATTDEDGMFRIANLAPGQYLLVAGPSFGIGRRPLRGSRRVREEQIRRTFYPGVSELDAATPVLISAGQQMQADFSLKPEPVFKVSGVVVGLGPGMGNGLQFTTRAAEPIAAPFTFDPQRATFQAELTAGSYVLQARVPDLAGNMLGADLPVVVTSDTQNVTLTLGPQLVVPVQVETRSTASSAARNPLDTAPIAFERFTSSEGISLGQHRSPFRTPQLQVRLISSETKLEPQEFQADNNGPDSSFALRNFAPGKYSVDLQPNAPWYVQSATSGTTDLLREELVIAAGQRPDPLEVVLRDDGATVSGSIHMEGQAASGAVLLVPEQASLAHARLAQAAPGGEFLFDRVPPGDYKLLAFDTVESLEFRNPEALAPYLSKATRITLHPGEQANVTLDRLSVGK